MRLAHPFPIFVFLNQHKPTLAISTLPPTLTMPVELNLVDGTHLISSRHPLFGPAEHCTGLDPDVHRVQRSGVQFDPLSSAGDLLLVPKPEPSAFGKVHCVLICFIVGLQRRCNHQVRAKEILGVYTPGVAIVWIFEDQRSNDGEAESGTTPCLFDDIWKQTIPADDHHHHR